MSFFRAKIEGGAKEPNLTPLPDINTFSRDKYKNNPLLKFSLQESKRRRVTEELFERAKKTKMNWAPRRPIDTNIIRLPGRNILQEIVILASRRPKSDLHASLWETIIQLVPKKGFEIGAELLRNLEKEIKGEFTELLHNLSIMDIVIWKPPKIYDTTFLKRPMLPGRSANYQKFLSWKSKLETTLLITHPFIRYIHETSFAYLPHTMISMTAISTQGYLTIEGASQFRFQEFNEKLQKILQWITLLHDKLLTKFSKPVSRPLLHKFCNCADYFIGEKLHEVVIRTCEHVIEASKNPYTRIQVQTSAKYNDGKFYVDSKEDFERHIIILINAVLSIPKNISSVGKVLGVRGQRTHIPAEQWEPEFSLVTMKDIKELVAKFFGDAEQYVENELTPLFDVLLSKEAENRFKILIYGNFPYEEYGSEIEYFQEFKIRSANLPQYQYFAGCRLLLDEVSDLVKITSDEHIRMLADRMCQKHMEDMLQICSELEAIARQAVLVPTNTAQLMEHSRYLLDASTRLVPDLREKIQEALRLTWKINEYVSLPPSQVQLTDRMLKLLLNIEDVLKDSGFRIEQQKFDHEERLYDTTQKMKGMVKELFPKLERLYKMDSANHVPSYTLEIRRFLGKVKELERVVHWINREEELMGRTQSHFIEVDELKNMLVPFAELVFLVNRWLRSKKAWLLSVPGEVHIEQILEKMLIFQRQLNDISKQFSQKIKAQSDTNYERRFPGVVDDPEFINRPAPIKLCSSALKQLDDFKRHLPILKILCSSALESSHWEEMSEIAETDLQPDAGFYLQKYLSLNLEKYGHEFEVIAMSAGLEQHVNLFATSLLLDETSVSIDILPEMEQLDDQSQSWLYSLPSETKSHLSSIFSGYTTELSKADLALRSLLQISRRKSESSHAKEAEKKKLKTKRGKEKKRKGRSKANLSTDEEEKEEQLLKTIERIV